MPHPFVMVAPTGARRGKADHPALPVTLPEIPNAAVACHAAGADGFHLHIRDDAGVHSLDAGRYRETLEALAQVVPDLAVQVTTEAAGIFDVADQLSCLSQLRPAWASISVREVARDPDLAARVYATCADAGTRVQHIAYDAADLALLHDWQARDIVRPDQTDVICVLGRYSEAQLSSPSDLDPFLTSLTRLDGAMACAFGPQEHICLAAAASHGFDLRVGFENSLTDAQGLLHPDNAASVAALIAYLKRNTA
tara:strand:- start:2712 stop:3470 length:759 start_codon:yes stop_codon:yes gene_type:complete